MILKSVCALLLCAVSVYAGEPLIRIADVRALPVEETEKGLPVHVSGVVTWARKPSFIVQDESGSIWVQMESVKSNLVWKGDMQPCDALRPGLVVELAGVTDRGGFSPMIITRKVIVLGEAPLPPFRNMEPARFFSGMDDCHRLEVRGVVQGFRRMHVTVLIVDANPGRFIVEMPNSAIPEPKDLVDAVIRVRGEAISLFNTRGEFLVPYIFASSEEGVIVERAPPSTPFDAPLVSLHGIARFREQSPGSHRVRVRGIVTYVAGPTLYLQDEGQALRVETSTPSKLNLGDWVEAAGFADMRRPIRFLSEAVTRKTGDGTSPTPAQVAPDWVLDVNRKAAVAGILAKPDDFDGRLIRFEARLAKVRPWGRKGAELLLVDGKTWLKATLDGTEGQGLENLRIGSVLDVTGIAQIEYIPGVPHWEGGGPIGISLLLRTPGDIAVVSAPSWWTLPRVLIALGCVLFAWAVAMAWVWMLHRQVAAQARLLASEMRTRHESAVEFNATLRERNRLAANLHDTLLQTMNGIGFQIDTCERTVQIKGCDAAEPFGVARRMVDHAVEELRGAVWELRGLALNGSSLADALSAMAAHAGEGQSVPVTVQTEGSLDHVPGFVAGNLLLIVQEALGNALRHARPSAVAVEVRADEAGTRLSVTVCDNGDGFDPAVAKGLAQGHFGLTGMKERAERLGGTLSVESSPGRGTCIHADITLKPYDEELS